MMRRAASLPTKRLFGCCKQRLAVAAAVGLQHLWCLPSSPQQGVRKFSVKHIQKEYFDVHSEQEAMMRNSQTFTIPGLKFRPDEIIRNPSIPVLYENAVKYESHKIHILSTGAMVANSGRYTGRSPKDKRIVREDTSEKDVWWDERGPNIALSESSFAINKQRAFDYLNLQDRIYCVDGYVNWDRRYRKKIRVLCSSAYHALFMRNMLCRPTAEEMANFGTPDFTIFNSGQFPANPLTPGLTSDASICVNFKTNELVILGTEYAGCMKKGIFTVMHYLMPLQNMLSMHCSANEGEKGDVSIFFGLSGTGKTTLSADPHRHLIGDDEHVWSETGVFNIEGGCYAKAIDLTEEKEPQIWRTQRFGTVLENVAYDPDSRVVDFRDASLTQNTRMSYAIEHMEGVKFPCIGGHPSHIIFLACDAFGVLPPVAELTAEQAMYHFISGYTAKVAGTEVGITDPVATFSSCFGEAFIVLHPARYAEMLAEKMKKHNAKAWLINTGWSGGPFGVGERMSLKVTRALIDAIHDGSLSRTLEDKQNVSTVPVFNLTVPTKVNNVPDDILIPKNTWKDKDKYDEKLKHLGKLFNDNFKHFESGASTAVKEAGPKV